SDGLAALVARLVWLLSSAHVLHALPVILSRPTFHGHENPRASSISRHHSTPPRSPWSDCPPGRWPAPCSADWEGAPPRWLAARPAAMPAAAAHTPSTIVAAK